MGPQTLRSAPRHEGLWQVSGRNELSHMELARSTTWYVASWSFWWDIYILWQTPAAVFRGRGARNRVSDSIGPPKCHQEGRSADERYVYFREAVPKQSDGALESIPRARAPTSRSSSSELVFTRATSRKTTSTIPSYVSGRKVRNAIAMCGGWRTRDKVQRRDGLRTGVPGESNDSTRVTFTRVTAGVATASARPGGGRAKGWIDHHGRKLASRTLFRRRMGFWLAPKGDGRDDGSRNGGKFA